MRRRPEREGAGAAPRDPGVLRARPPAAIHTKRWNDAAEPGDGVRLLVTRYRPRGVPKGDETWDAWMPRLAPSRDLIADYHGKHGPPIAWAEFRRRYLAEMKNEKEAIAELAARAAAGQAMTLLCSSACTDPARCHRTLLKALVEGQLEPPRP